jgi:hypothetical protein
MKLNSLFATTAILASVAFVSSAVAADTAAAGSTTTGTAATGTTSTASAASTMAATNPYKLDPKDPNAAKACTDKGGKVSSDKDGNKICTLPKANQ